MAEENVVETPEEEAEFEAAFADRAEKSANTDPAGIDPGEAGDDDAGEEEKVFDEAFDSAAVQPAAAKEDKDANISDELAATKAELERLTQSERSQRGRVSALTKKLLEQKAASVPPKQKEEISVDTGAANQSDDWEEFQREFPEMAAIVDKRLSTVTKQVESVSSRVDMVSSTQDTLVDSTIETYRTEQFDALRKSHPDAEDVKISPDFHKWRQTAPEDIQQKIKSHHAEDAAKVLDAFKAETGWSKTPQPKGKSEVQLINERREKTLQNSAGISSKKVGHSPRSNTEPDDDFDAAFTENAHKKEKARSRNF